MIRHKRKKKTCKPFGELNAPFKLKCSSSRVVHAQTAQQTICPEQVVVGFRQFSTSSLNEITNPPAQSCSLYIKNSSPEAAESADADSWSFLALTLQASVHCGHPDLHKSGYNFETLYNLLSSLTLFSRCALIITHVLHHKNTKLNLDYASPLSDVCIYIYTYEAVRAGIGLCFPLKRLFFKCCLLTSEKVFWNHVVNTTIGKKRGRMWLCDCACQSHSHFSLSCAVLQYTVSTTLVCSLYMHICVCHDNASHPHNKERRPLWCQQTTVKW